MNKTILKPTSAYSLTDDPDWVEKLEEYFEETAVTYQNFSKEADLKKSDQVFQIGFITPGFAADKNLHQNRKLFKLGSGELEDVSWCGRLDKTFQMPEITKEILSNLDLLKDSWNCLVVDDDEDFCALIKESWENKNRPHTEVRTARNGFEALKLFKAARPDVMILDLKMPGLGGAEFYRQIRLEDQLLPVIILSAVTESEEIKRLRQIGNPVCIEKSTTESRPDSLWWRALKLKVFGSQDAR